MRDIEVSVICNTYNHEKYIRKALEGFVMQKTNFAFEVLIHDDASTDKTADIIREYETKYPEIIKPVYQKENQYSKGIKYSKLYQHPRVKGKYVAFCEGDDYWCDPLKLQKQYDAMEAHPEIDICAHGNICVSERGEEINNLTPQHSDGVIPVEEVIMGEGGFVSTNSLFYRRILIDKTPKFREIWTIDYTLQIYGSLRGGMYYISDVMSAYRYCSVGSWTMRTMKNNQKLIELDNKKTLMLKELDLYTEYKYTDTIKERLRRNEFELAVCLDENKKVLNKKYRDLFKKFTFKNRMKVRIKAYFPFLITLKRKLKSK